MTKRLALASAAMAVLAGNFNRLLGVAPGHFESGAKADGSGASRAAKRLAAFREAQAERLKDAGPDSPSRQVLRAEARRAGKMPVGMSRRAWHIKMGYPR